MQLGKPKNRKVGKLLANASMALLCATSASAQEAPSKQGFFEKNIDNIISWAKWSGELGLLGYSESKGRVKAIEPAIKLNAEFSGERVWSTKLVFDSLTGASPNGALNSGQPQTFTSPSGKASYVVKPGEQPLYDQFKDSRINIATSWSQPISRLWKYNVGLNGSSEFDYLSLGVNSSLTKESQDKIPRKDMAAAWNKMNKNLSNYEQNFSSKSELKKFFISEYFGDKMADAEAYLKNKQLKPYQLQEVK